MMRVRQLIIIVLMSGCNHYPDEVMDSLSLAGNNRSQLEEVINHYENDKEKLKATYFLIANMRNKGTYVNELVDSDGESIGYNISGFDNEREENSWLDSIKKIRGPLRSHENFLPDLEHVSSQFLIRNIDRAFEIRQKSPFCKGISDNDFYEYILPYRVSMEKLEFWRDTIISSFSKEQKDSLYSFTTVLAAANYIDNIYQNHFEFGGPRFYKEKKVRSYTELMNDRKGKCNDMCNLVVMALRAMGIPSGFDGIRYKRGSNAIGHGWCFVMDTKSGKTYPFDALENNGPGWFNLPYKNAPKAYRRQFTEVEPSSIKSKYSVIHPHFFLDNSLDVTAEYFETTEITVDLGKKYETPIYLSIWHKGQWTPVDYYFDPMSMYAKFKDVTKDNLYCITSYNLLEHEQITPPFVVNQYGELKYMESLGIKKRVTLNDYNHRQVRLAKPQTEVFDFITQKKVGERIVEGDLSRGKWIDTSEDDLFTNTLYIFSDSLNPKGQVFILKNDGSIDWY